MNEKLIPFDLAKCRAGEEVVTRDGRPYKFGAYNEDISRASALLGWIGTNHSGHYQNGRFKLTEETIDDLFMKPKTRKVTIYIYEKTDGRISVIEGPHGTPMNGTLLEIIEREYAI